MSRQDSELPTRSAPFSERSILLPHGRIGRVAYGVRTLATLACYFVVGSVQELTSTRLPNALITGLSYLVFAFLVVTSIKRLHDIGYGALSVVFLGPIIPLLLFAGGEKGANVYGGPPIQPFSGMKTSQQTSHPLKCPLVNGIKGIKKKA